MKKGWQTKTLGELCSFENGDRGENYPSKSVQTTSGVPFTNAGHLSESGIDFSDMNYIPRERFELLGNGKIRKDDILFCLRGSLGKFASVGDLSEGAIASSLVIVRPSGAILNDFVLAYLQSDLCAEMIQEFRNGAAQPNLAAASLKKFSIPVPPLAEQQRIVGLLDEAFEGLATAKANAEKNLQNARALFESHLQSVFTQRGPGWVQTTLDSCCEQIFAGGDVPKDRLSQERTPKYSVPIFSNGEKDDGLYGFTDVARVTKPAITVSARGTLGFTAIRTEPFLPVVRLIVLVPDEKLIMLSFLYYAVVGMDFGNTGTSIPQLTVPNCKESKLHVPSLSEQKAIVEKLDALSEETQRLASLYERKLAALEALKKSLLHQAFTGEL